MLIKTKQEYKFIMNSIEDDGREHVVFMYPDRRPIRAANVNGVLYLAHDTPSERFWHIYKPDALADGTSKPQLVPPNLQIPKNANGTKSAQIPVVPFFEELQPKYGDDVSSRLGIYANPLPHWDTALASFLQQGLHVWYAGYSTPKIAFNAEISRDVSELADNTFSWSNVVEAQSRGDKFNDVSDNNQTKGHGVKFEAEVKALRARGIIVDVQPLRSPESKAGSTRRGRKLVDAETGGSITERTKRVTTAYRFRAVRRWMMVDIVTGKPTDTPGAIRIPRSTWRDRRIVDAATGKEPTSDTSEKVTWGAYRKKRSKKLTQ